MSQPTRKPALQRLSLAAIPALTIIAMVGFWRLAPGLTFIVAVVAFIALIAAMWAAGKEP